MSTSRRGFIRIGAATVGSLALRPFGLISALAQPATSQYQALVCVFLLGGNDGHNTVIPIITAQQNYSLYQQYRGGLGRSAPGLRCSQDFCPPEFAAPGDRG